MKDLVEYLWRSLSQYVPVLVAVISAPRTGTYSLASEGENRFARALSFVGITVAIGFLLQAPLARDTNELTTVVGSMIAFKVLAILAGAGVILAAFRLVGGNAGFEPTLCAYIYIVCPIYLAGIVLNLMIGGALAGYDPESAHSWFVNGFLTQEATRNLTSGSPELATMVSMFVRLQTLVVLVWPVMCWGALRMLNGVSRLRSAVAYVIAFSLFAFVLFPVFALVARGLHGGTLPPIQ